MKILLLTVFLGFLPGWTAQAQPQDSPSQPLQPVQSTALTQAALSDEGRLNVNARYTIESINITGWRARRVSESLKNDIDRLKGTKLDYPKLEALASAIKLELHVPKVELSVTRGAIPDHVVVTFEIPRSHQQDFELNVARFLYHSKQGWTGEGSATTRIHGNAFTFGLVSDGDALLERFAGVRAGYQRRNLGTDRLGLRFNFASYHNQWNLATLSQNSRETYRTRQVFEPEAMLYITPQLELDFGFRFSRYRLAAPGANTESSNAVVSTLRYHQRWGSDPKTDQQEIDSSYSITAATHVLESDRSYTRQAINANYRLRRHHNSLELAFLAGKIAGVAPLFDRFVLGNAVTLRGWNKFVLDPLGGSRVVHGSINYAYRWFQVFYDTGAIWNNPSEREQKQSVGVGFKAERFQLAAAFPLRAGHADPIFYAGMNF